MSAPIEVGACYRDSEDGEIVRVLRLDRDGLALVRRVGADWPGCALDRFEDLRFGTWERVPDPTPAVIDDELVHDEAARQERIDATARMLWTQIGLDVAAQARGGYVDPDVNKRMAETAELASANCYSAADMLEAARERYIASRKGGVK